MKFRGQTIDGQPAARWDQVHKACSKHARFIIEVRKYDEAREISLQQMAFLHAVVIPLFVDYTGDSPQYWQNKLKLECGSKWFKVETVTVGKHSYTIIPSKTKLSVNDFSEWYQNISDFGDSIDCPVPPPDPNWRINQQQETEG